MKSFVITRLEKSTIIRKVEYEICADTKKEALERLGRTEFNYRNSDDDFIEEYNLQPLEIVEISEQKF